MGTSNASLSTSQAYFESVQNLFLLSLSREGIDWTLWHCRLMIVGIEPLEWRFSSTGRRTIFIPLQHRKEEYQRFSLFWLHTFIQPFICFLVLQCTYWSLFCRKLPVFFVMISLKCEVSLSRGAFTSLNKEKLWQQVTVLTMWLYNVEFIYVI
jgi:hypothetical protein